MWKEEENLSCFTCELPGFKTYLQLALLEFLNFLVPPFCNLQNEDANSISFIDLLWALNKLTFVKHLGQFLVLSAIYDFVK